MHSIKPIKGIQILLNILILLLFARSFSQIIPGAYERYEIDGNRLVIFDEYENRLIIHAHSGSILKIAYFAAGEEEDSSVSVVLGPDSLLVSDIQENELILTYSYANIHLTIDKANLMIDCHRNGEELISVQQVSLGNLYGNLTLSIDESDHLFGGGSRAIPMDLRGRELEIYNQTHYGYGWEEPNMNICIPYIHSSGNYSIFFDNHQKAVMDLSIPGEISYRPEEGPARFWLLTSADHEAIVSDMARLTGHQPLPPRWALGYIQSRFGYQDRQEAEYIVQNMLNEGFPLAALVLDLYWQGEVGEMGNLDWDETRFPDAAGMIGNFSEQGINTILITDPYVTQDSYNYGYLNARRFFCKNTSGNTYLLNDFWAGPSGLLDLHNEEAWEWMWQHYQPRIEEGIAGWWCDLGEPELHPEDMVHTNGTANEVHNIYSLHWAEQLQKSVYENYPGRRHFNLTRSGFAGMQRYSTFPWSADVQRSFDGMRAQVPIILSMGLCGVPFMHYDMCGFTGGIDEELYTRWFQMGTFAPVMRSHGTGDPPEPIFREEETKNIVRRYAKLRHRLLPYNYTLAWESATTGIPMARPLFFYDESTLSYDFLDFQYFWGENLLIAPVFNPGQFERYTYVPVGQWIDFDNDLTYNGGMVFPVNSPPEKMPVLVKAGSIIPLSSDFQTFKDYSTSFLSLQYYPDPSITESCFTMYHDDGISRDAIEMENYELILMEARYESGDLDFSLVSEQHNTTGPVNRTIEIISHRSGPPSMVTADGEMIPRTVTKEEYEASDQAWYHDTDDNLVLIRFQWDGQDVLVEADQMEVIEKYAQIAKPTVQPELRIFPNPARTRAQIEYYLTKPSDIRITLIDASGREVVNSRSLTGQAGYNRENINLEGIRSGIYLLKFSAGSSRTMLKLLKH